jgi:hypothetical protein
MWLFWFFCSKPIAIPPEHSYQISAKSVQPSLIFGRTKFGRTDGRTDSIQGWAVGRIFHLPTFKISLCKILDKYIYIVCALQLQQSLSCAMSTAQSASCQILLDADSLYQARFSSITLNFEQGRLLGVIDVIEFCRHISHNKPRTQTDITKLTQRNWLSHI